MVKKHRKFPIAILMLEALLRRLHPQHPSRAKIKFDLRVRRSGYYGETQLDYHMAHLPRKNHYIFHDLRLPLTNKDFFQIDSLLLSSSYFMIYEAKNHAGTLTFEEQQMLQTYEGYTESYPNPIVQAENQQYHMEKFIGKHFGFTLPGTSFVVVTNPSSIIKFATHYEQIASRKVIRPLAIRQKSEGFWDHHPIPLLSHANLQKLCRLLLKLHTPLNTNIFKTFDVKKSDILPGVFCSNCQSLSMARVFGTWKCRRCRYLDKHAHIPALADYYLLNGDTITNRQLRQFLQLDSVTVATNLLGALRLPFDGTFKDRKYYLSLERLRN
ncbi:nuclease-related domain-containing protein [Siminovitchia sediminis]|uniref:Nuclease-related domain-containing protein n=1 Tax=Siminovitchia sediminis TaxID=1274353 RepID=A0ABW4KJM2_9BACI